MRILVQIFHIGMCRSTVEVEVIFFDILAVVALVAGQTEKTFLQNWVVLVPESYGEANQLSPITNAGQTVFVPTEDTRTGVVVGEVFPSVAIGAVIFADCAPGSFAEVRSPALPMLLADRKSTRLNSSHLVISYAVFC